MSLAAVRWRSQLPALLHLTIYLSRRSPWLAEVLTKAA